MQIEEPEVGRRCRAYVRSRWTVVGASMGLCGDILISSSKRELSKGGADF